MKFKEKIAIYYTNLTSNEKSLCTEIMEHPDYIIDNNIIDAANKLGTSKSTLLRFAQKLEYKGYSDLKYSLIESENTNDFKEDRHASILEKINRSFISTIDTIVNPEYDQMLLDVVKLIRSMPYTKSIGIGNTSLSAEQLVYSLYSHDMFIDSITDRIKFKYLENVLNENYLLIIFSVSSSSDTYLHLLKQARKKGAKVVIITMNNDAVINKYADYLFVLPSTLTPIDHSKILKQIDNRTILYYFAEIISYYFGLIRDDLYVES